MFKKGFDELIDGEMYQSVIDGETKLEFVSESRVKERNDGGNDSN